MNRFFTISVCLLLLAGNGFVKAQTCHAGVVSALRDTVCIATPAQLIVTGSSGNIQWQWATTDTFSNISGATDTTLRSSPLLKLSYFYFRVVVSNGSCSDTSSAFRVFVPDPITTEFTMTTTGSYTISFNSDSSKGHIISYHWDFGDGDTSTMPNPVHTYTKGNTFYVCLTLYDGSDCSYTFCRNIDQQWDPPGDCPPSFGFSYSGDTVSFHSTSVPNTNYYSWSFGDGNVSDTSDPVHVYTTSGAYSVCLTISSSIGCGGETCHNVYPGLSAIVPVSASQHIIIVYPNPCTYCEIKGIQNPNDLLVTDLLGRVIPVSFSKQSNGYHLNFPFASTGMYLIRNKRTGEVVKLVKE